MSLIDAIVALRRIFRIQLVARGLFSAAITGAFVFGLTLLTANLFAWWFDAFPWMRDLANWIRASNPWDFFVLVFIVVNAFNYLYIVQGVLVDRYNLRILVSLSEEELKADESPRETISLRRAMLGGRRRLLESVLRFYPTLWTLGALIASLVFLGHWTSGVVVLVFGIGVVLFVPIMIARFTARRNDAISRGQLQALPERSKDPRERAERSLAQTGARLRMFVDRPIERLRVGWPVLVAAAMTVAAVAALTIGDMHRAGELPERSTLLVLLLVISGRAALSSAQHSEDLAFFASALTEIQESEDGVETL